MPLYKVMWEIEVEADTAENAAGFARDLQLDPTSEANFFEVTDEENQVIKLQVINMDNEVIH